MRIPATFKTFCRRIAGPYLEATPKQRLMRLALTVVLAGAAVGGEVWVYQHYRIAWDRQVLKCLDWHLLWLSLDNKELIRDKIYAYKSVQAAPAVKVGTLMGKMLRGMPGDTVEVRSDETVLINGKVVAEGLPHLAGMTPEQRSKYFGKRVLGENEYWMLGTKYLSFDSRYWGPIQREQIVARAYPLF